MNKSADAFRTISEVADWLSTPAHVLRFWESKFAQVKPVKRAGGRRYYRPADMKLLGGIKRLLHDDGMTIKGVQKLLREQGLAHVAGLSQPLGDAADDVEVSGLVIEAEAQPANDVPTAGTEPAQVEESQHAGVSEAAAPSADAPDADAAAATVAKDSAAPADVPQEDSSVTEPQQPTEPPAPDPVVDEPAVLPSFLNRRQKEESAAEAPTATSDRGEEVTADPEPPSAASEPPAPEPSPATEPASNITIPDLPDDPPDDIAADPGALAALARLPRPVSAELARDLQRIATALRATGGAGGQQ
ncbi:MAG: MerR family transcriptional regulator [Pseudomonadota bacterium]